MEETPSYLVAAIHQCDLRQHEVHAEEDPHTEGAFPLDVDIARRIKLPGGVRGWKITTTCGCVDHELKVRDYTLRT